MKSETLLEQYREERNQLLSDIIVMLEGDPRVKAAWLCGSLGRGNEDALSDIDLWVIMDDKYIGSVINQPRRYTAQIDTPILCLGAPQNAPDGGAYLMTCYDAIVAPHIVDWYWQPQSLAYIPNHVRLIFDRVGLIHRDQPVRFSGQPASKELSERPMHFISYFWMMLMITAKYAWRSPRREEMELLPLLLDPIEKAQLFLGSDRVLQPGDIPPHQLPGEKIQLLYQFADQMRNMMASISEQGEEVPTSVIPGAYRYLSLISTILPSSW